MHYGLCLGWPGLPQVFCVTSSIPRYWASTTGDDVHLPSAPLRIYRFTSAGGRAAEISEGSGLPRGCVFKVGFAGGNPYNGKVILMDEGHHLVRPSKLYETQLSNLRKLVKAAKNSVFVSLTGSMADSASDAGDLLKVVKGIGNEALSDEGFLSSHCRRGASFPTQRPAACADGVLSEECDGLVHREELAGFSLARYMYQSIKLHREKKPNDGLACYANIHCYMNAVGKATCKHQLMHHDDCRPKFTAAVNDVVAAAKYKQKSMVMVSKRTGYKVMLWLLEAAGKRHKFNVARPHVTSPFLIVFGQEGLDGFAEHTVHGWFQLRLPIMTTWLISTEATMREERNIWFCFWQLRKEKALS